MSSEEKTLDNADTHRAQLCRSINQGLWFDRVFNGHFPSRRVTSTFHALLTDPADHGTSTRFYRLRLLPP